MSMPDVPPDFASLGRRLKQRLLLALCLSSGLPLLVLAYVVHRYIVPEVASLSTVSVAALEGLVFFTALAVVGGVSRNNHGATAVSHSLQYGL